MNPTPFAPFETTPWSTILECQGVNPERAQAALSRLCEAYWPPVHGYLRRRGYSDPDAKDLTQGLFERMLERGDFRAADPGKGRFRSYLLTCLKHFEWNERVRSRALKRGGGEPALSLEDPLVRADGPMEPAQSSQNLQCLFDRDWAARLVDRVLIRLHKEEEESGRGELFRELQSLLTRDESPEFREALARKYGVERGTIDTRVSRLRMRYRTLLRNEVGHLVSDASEVEDEIRYLQRVLALEV